MKHPITFLPQNLLAHAPEGTTIFNAANWAGLAIDSTCGGRGTCGKCKVRLAEGGNSITEADHKYLSSDELDHGWRLSCRAVIHQPSLVEVPRMMTAPQAALLGYGRHVALEPNVKKVYLSLPEPSLEDQRGDLQRLLDALTDGGYAVRAGPAVWRALPRLLREHSFAVTAVICDDELIVVEGGDTTAQAYGLAVDVGTTTVVTALIDLHTGAVAAVKSTLNGQATFGADVIARIRHTMLEEDGLVMLQRRIVATLNDLIGQILEASPIKREHIYEVVVVGNAAGEGAKMALLSFREREAANQLPDFIEYLELSGRPEFNDIFTEALSFPALSEVAA